MGRKRRFSAAVRWLVLGASLLAWNGCATEGLDTCDDCEPLPSPAADAGTPEPDAQIGTSQITIQLAGAPGAGRVLSTPAGIDCGTTCDASFSAGTKVVLHGEPVAGDQRFEGWMGACLGSAPCELDLDFSQHVFAYFSTGCEEAKNHSDLAWIQDNILTPSCARSGCHAGSAGGLRLTAGVSEAQLVDVPSKRFPERIRVVPGSPETSHLMTMLGAYVGPLQGSMPPDDVALCAEKLGAVERWINSLPE